MTEQVADQSVIEAFKQRARSFWSQWQKLANQENTITKQSPEIQQQYADLIDRGSTIRSSVETVTGLIDKATQSYQSAKGWVSDIFGMDGYEPNLGFLPLLIPAAVITASLAAMGKWLSDAYEFNRKMEEIAKLERKGIDPVTASKIIERVSPSGISLKTAFGLPLLLIGGFVVYNIIKGR